MEPSIPLGTGPTAPGERRVPLVLLLFTSLAFGCGDGTGPGPVPVRVLASRGVRQVGPVGVPLSVPLEVRVTDRKYRPVPGVPLTWTVADGDGSVSVRSTATDSAGKAGTSFTPGRVGRVDVTAHVPGLDDVTFRPIGQAEALDPLGDARTTFRSAGLAAPDLVRVTAWPQNGSLMLELEFAQDVALLHTGGTNVVVGIVDIDTDSDPGTGAAPGTDVYRTDGGTSGLGVERYLTLSTSPGGILRVRSPFDASFAGAVTASLDHSRVLTLPIPLEHLGGDDGLVNLVVLVGTRPEPTDVVPDSGSLVMAPIAPPLALALLRPGRFELPDPWIRR